MKETQVRQQLYRFFREAGEEPITQTDATRCPKCGTLVKPPIGRPDILVSPAFVVEVKTMRPGETSFPMGRIDEKQRRWLTWFRFDQGKPAYIGLGIIRKHGSLDSLEHLYLVPWEMWLCLEEVICNYQESIPLRAGPGYKTELQEQNLDITTQFEHYELRREEGKWHLPELLSPLIKRQ